MIKRILIVSAVFIIAGLMWGHEATYTRTATVTNSNNGIVTVKDNCNFIWKYEGTATVGDSVTLVMYDNHTSKVSDDIVKGVK